MVISKGLLRKLTHSDGAADFGGAERKAVELAAMNAVMQIERSFGFRPRDVSAENRGYDIESFIPEDKRTDGKHLRFIEVKGRRKGAETVTVTSNEVLTALNSPDAFILAIVEVDGDKTRAVYLKRPFRNRLDFTAKSANYDIRSLILHVEIVYQE